MSARPFVALGGKGYPASDSPWGVRTVPAEPGSTAPDVTSRAAFRTFPPSRSPPPKVGTFRTLRRSQRPSTGRVRSRDLGERYRQRHRHVPTPARARLGLLYAPHREVLRRVEPLPVQHDLVRVNPRSTPERRTRERFGEDRVRAPATVSMEVHVRKCRPGLPAELASPRRHRPRWPPCPGPG